MKHPFKHGAKYVALAFAGAGLFHLAVHGIHPQVVPNGMGDNSGRLVVERSRLTPSQWRELARKDGIKFLSVVQFLTAGAGTLQTYNVPSDFNPASNSAEVFGAGASGAAVGTIGTSTISYATGGGAGGYSKKSNINLTPGGTASYEVGSGGASVSTTGNSNGNGGGDSWFNGATFGAASCAAKGGVAGVQSATAPLTGSAGGAAASGIGDVTRSGGRGGSISAGVISASTGGGGTAGPNGDGNHGVDFTTASSSGATDGGSGDAGSGGAAGSGVLSSGAATGSNGGDGAEYTATAGGTAGAGGGGGGAEATTTGNATGGNGGNYGGAGGAGLSGGASGISGAGTQGLIVVTYNPAGIVLRPPLHTAAHVSWLPPDPGPTLQHNRQPYQQTVLVPPISGPAAQNPPFPGASIPLPVHIWNIPPPPQPPLTGIRTKAPPSVPDNPTTHGLGRTVAPLATFLAWDAWVESGKSYQLPHGHAQRWTPKVITPPISGPPPQNPPRMGPLGATLLDNIQPTWIPPQYRTISARNLHSPISGPAVPSKANLFNLFNQIVAAQNLTWCDFDLYTITLFNGSVLRYTTADFDIAANGNTYTSQSVRIDQAASKAVAHWKIGLDVDTWTVIFMPRPTDIITGAAFPDTIGSVPWIQAAHSGYLDAADVQVDRAWFSAMPTWPIAPGGAVPTGTRTIFAGKVAAVDTTDLVVVLTINDYRDLFTVTVPLHFYSAQCRHTLFDTACNADGTMTRDRFMQGGTVANGSTRGNIIPSGGMPNPGGSGTYTLGIVQMTSGKNNGFQRTVSNWDGTNLKLVAPFPFNISVGDTFTASAGCDLQRTTCIAFGNLANYGGMPFIPAPETLT